MKKIFIITAIAMLAFSVNASGLSAPQNLRATSRTTNSAILKWDKVTDAHHYTVQLKNKNRKTIKTFKNIENNKKEAKNLKAETKYYFRVKACDQINICSNYSALKKFKTKSAKAINEFTIIAQEFSFSPNTISAKVGDKIKITFKNNGIISHNLTFAWLNIATSTISPGARDIIEFTAKKAGTYIFYCSISEHKDAGMQGKLKIE